jgi:hypothetical protein
MGTTLDRAVLRFARFPSIAELYDIAYDLQHQAEIIANSERLSKARQEWKQSQSGGGST